VALVIIIAPIVFSVVDRNLFVERQDEVNASESTECTFPVLWNWLSAAVIVDGMFTFILRICIPGECATQRASRIGVKTRTHR
jgi:hypothetical protein